MLLGLLGLPDFGVQNQQVQVSLRERGIKVEGLLGFGDGIVNAANLFELNTALEMRRRTHVERPEFVAQRVRQRRNDVVVAFVKARLLLGLLDSP